MKSFLFVLLFVLSTDLWARRRVLLWLSIDGMRPDYVDRANTPNLRYFMNHGVYSRKLAPNFPSITFPSHCTEATGTLVQEHGIPLNGFYDSATKASYKYPDEAKLLTAEPFWQTVKRQGKRSAVLNWPLSFKAEGPNKPDYELPAYQKELSDAERIRGALELWQKDLDAGKDLDLLMFYIVGPDSVGHRYGPEDKRVLEVVEEVDKLLGEVRAKIMALSSEPRHKDTEFFLFLTTDHGMATVKTSVELEKLSALPGDSKVRLLATGPIGQVYVDEVPPKDRPQVLSTLMKTYRKIPYAHAYLKKDLPKHWGFAHPSRVGDIVITLDPGYSFVSPGGFRPAGMHGYEPKVSAEMHGLLVLYRYPEIKKAREIPGPVDTLSLHPSMARLLGISPSPKAKGKPVKQLTDWP